jgi:alcohol dehydrogenase class IV
MHRTTCTRLLKPQSTRKQLERSLRSYFIRHASTAVHTPEIVLQAGCAWGSAGTTVVAKSSRCLVVQGISERAQELAHRLMFELRKARVDCVTYTMDNYHPLNTTVDEGLAVARRVGATCVVGIGSGGIIDNAKAIAALFGSSGVCIPHLECPSDAVLGIQNAARQRRLAQLDGVLQYLSV